MTKIKGENNEQKNGYHRPYHRSRLHSLLLLEKEKRPHC
jgi:hypothetical protein